MAAVALPNTATIDMKNLAVQCQQIKDNTGNAVDVSVLVGKTNPVYKSAGSTLALTYADQGKVILLDTLTGSVVTLPASTGKGAKFRFVVSVLATSASHIVKVANVSDAMQGIILTEDGGTLTGWPATAGTSDTITLNRGTTGSVVKGEEFTVEDIALNVWQVSGVTASSGTAATPFSATV